MTGASACVTMRGMSDIPRERAMVLVAYREPVIRGVMRAMLYQMLFKNFSISDRSRMIEVDARGHRRVVTA